MALEIIHDLDKAVERNVKAGLEASKEILKMNSNYVKSIALILSLASTGLIENGGKILILLPVIVWSSYYTKIIMDLFNKYCWNKLIEWPEDADNKIFKNPIILIRVLCIIAWLEPLILNSSNVWKETWHTLFYTFELAALCLYILFEAHDDTPNWKAILENVKSKISKMIKNIKPVNS